MAELMDVFIGNTNDSTPRATGLTRGLVAAALVGGLNAVLIFLPLDPDQKIALLAALNPVVIVASHLLYGVMDHMMKHSDHN